jgi:hypothetical protein
VIGNLLIVEYSFLSSFSLVVLSHWSKCFVLGILLGLSIFCLQWGLYVNLLFGPFIFFSLYQKYKKILILHYNIFSFDYLVLILKHVERLHFIEIVEISLKVAFKILPSLENLRLRLNNIFIFIYLIC